MRANQKTAGGAGPRAIERAATAATTDHTDNLEDDNPPVGIENILARLKQPIPPEAVKSREGWRDRNGNTHMVEYVEWHYVADLLDRIAPTWSHSVRGIVQIGDMIAVTAAITIEGVTREGIGCGSADNETGIKKAEHDALKRAAVKFGIARQLYQRESEIIEKTGGSNTPFGGGAGSDKPRNARAASDGDKATGKQLGMLRARVREAQGDAEAVCHAAFGFGTEELSKKGCSWLIDNFAAIMQGEGEEIHDTQGGDVPKCSHGPMVYKEWTPEGGALQAAYVCPHRGKEKDCKAVKRVEPIPM